MATQTFTLTFGDQAENHAGMQKLGTMAAEGFSRDDLERGRLWFLERGAEPVLYDLRSLLPLGVHGAEAYLLVVPGGVSKIVSADELYREQEGLEKDTKAFMYGRVVEKRARHNLCFGEAAQEPNYEQGMGRVVAFDQVPLLNRLRQTLSEVIGEKGRGLMAEGNYYYDLQNCYIGYHGDSERKKVIAVRLGAPFLFHYQWFSWSKPVGAHGQIPLNHGDLYIMSEKAVGTDWKTKKVPTLRHAAGDPKHLKVKQ